MARPRKDPAEQRRHRISYTLTDAELERLEARAARVGAASIHRFAREMALERPMRVSETPVAPFELLRELRAIGVNINQQTRKLNATGAVTPELRRLWAKLDGLLMRLMAHGPADR
ncbi:MAG: plasmid mobilization relaxosome protein MobC [Pseudomonadota bacterium]